MLHWLVLNSTKFQLPPPKHLSTVVKNILGKGHAPMSIRVNGFIHIKTVLPKGFLQQFEDAFQVLGQMLQIQSRMHIHV